MQPNTNGGDGVTMGPTGEEPVEKAAPIQGEVSANQAELESKIEQELGLPHVEAKTEKKTDGLPEDTGSDDAGDTTAGEPGNPEQQEDDEDTQEELEEPTKTLEPSTPSDEELFIEVEDAEGVTHKISKIEDLPEDFSPKNNRQILQIVSQLNKLETQMEQREIARQEAADKAETVAAQQAQFSAWDNEIEELHKQKRIDPSDVERVNKVFEHIATINKARGKAGNPNLITSFEDGLDKFEIVEAKNKADEEKKKENDRAKLKSSLIGGSTSTGGGSGQRYYSGRYRSMDDVPV